MRRLIALCFAATLGGTAVAGACTPSEEFSCEADEQCLLVELAGICVAGDCAYPDATCMSGYRFATGAKAMAGQCVDPSAVGDDPSGTDTGTEMGTGS